MGIFYERGTPVTKKPPTGDLFREGSVKFQRGVKVKEMVKMVKMVKQRGGEDIFSKTLNPKPVSLNLGIRGARNVQGSGFRVQGSGFRVQGSGCRIQGSRFRVRGSGFGVQGSGFRVQGSGVRVQGFELTLRAVPPTRAWACAQSRWPVGGSAEGGHNLI